MMENSSWLATMPPHPDGVLLPAVAGIIDGWMTVSPGAGGGISFRVVVGINDGQAVRRHLLELIISPEHKVDLASALAHRSTATFGDADSLSFPCRIGFCSNVMKSTARPA